MPDDLDPRDATCAFCFVPLPEHPEPLCSPGVVRELRAELAALKATMAGDYAEKIEQIHAERAAMPEAERIRHEVADAPLLRIQLAGVATERKALKAAESAWRQAQTGLFHAREEALCRAVAAENRAEQAEAAIARVRALHSPETNPRRTRDCKGCRTVATITPYESCRTIAALDASSTPESQEAPRHVGGGANAEDCPACSGTNPPYPFICPGDAPESQGDSWLDRLAKAGPRIYEGKMRPVSVESPGNDGFRYEPESREATDA